MDGETRMGVGEAGTDVVCVQQKPLRALSVITSV